MILKEKERLINCRNWTNLVKPEKLIKDEKSTQTYGKFTCEPLERGYGTTLGNSLRRILLSSLQGAAIVAVKFEGIQHEFSTIPGVKEDVTDIILNLKQVNFLMETETPQKLVLHATQKGDVLASAIQENQNIRVLNPEHKIATLSEDRELRLELEVYMGKSYVPAEQQQQFNDQIGVIVLDASFSPIRKVSYKVEQARVGQMTNYDKLIFEVWTDGSVLPEDGIAYSAKILKDQLNIFVNFDEQRINEHEPDTGGDEIDENLFKSIDDLELPVRAANCLKKANLNTVGELVQQSENDLLKAKNFGRKSLDDIIRVLEDMGLELGMHIDNFEEKYQQWKKGNDSYET
ncbi:MAG: DNA-directed RNA polymerase subunit alpha [Desulfohalobiaceae bacterium]|nr:DNA-directed RNA polymerase subunit alpha [Desulfohalobiaceae bacterium]